MSNHESNNANEGQSRLTVGLAACPCGKTPQELYIVDGWQGGKWAWAYGGCCGEWHIEFRTGYNDLGSDECKRLAREAWNAAPRAANVEVSGLRGFSRRSARLPG